MKLKHFAWHFLPILFLCAAAPLQRGRELTPIDQLGEKHLTFLQPALDASFGFRLDPGVNCTGTYISDKGHFITALHCISACLAKSGALVRERALPGHFTLRPTFKVSVDEVRLKDITCKGKIGNKDVEVTVIATGGKGWLEPKNSLAAFSKRFPEEYKELVDEGFEHSADYAVLQVVNTKPKTCLPLVSVDVSEGETLHAVSFPCLKRDELRTSGQTPLYTSGVTTKGFKESEYFKKLGPRKIEFHVESVDRKETFFSTLDIEKCGSGSALFDDRLKIVGIATRVYKTSTRYESGGLESIRSSHILKELKNKRPADFEEITSCSAKSHASHEASQSPLL